MGTIDFTKEDYLTSVVPFEYIEQSDNALEKEQRKALVTEHAKSVGIKNFTTLYKAYLKMLKQMASNDLICNATNFTGQEFELEVGTWTADDGGISRVGYGGMEEVACPHPIMPVLRLDNVDTGLEKIKLAYRRGAVWKDIIVDRKQIASNSSIVGLADYGIAVTSENARSLVKYLHDAENLNFDVIPSKKSVSRLGWVGDDGFSPYVDGLVFDGEEAFKSFFNSVKQKGSNKKWLDLAKEIRNGDNPAPKILLVAAFASVLVEPCSCLPFFVHVCGGTETGKTVGLMLAASVWANPEMGKYIHTFNSTAVAQELSAGFVNSLPLILDELQIIKDRKDFDQLIYQLSEGVGKARGQKTGGLQRNGTWANCIITSGEQPITSNTSGGGAVNRIIEISCEDTKLFDDPGRIVKVVKSNYGHAGKEFIRIISDDSVMQEAINLQQLFFKELNQKSTEKQALAASLLLTADVILGEYMFFDQGSINIEDMKAYLSSKEDVSQNKRAYEWLQGWIAENHNSFITDNYTPLGKIYGRISSGEINIIRNVFNSACSENGFNPTEFAKWLSRNNLTDVVQGRVDKRVRINGIRFWTIALHINIEDETSESIGFVEVQEEIPF